MLSAGMSESKADPFRLIAREVREASRDNFVANDPKSKPQVFGLDVVIDPKLGPNEFELRY